jgi:hypothetical protein
MSIVPTHISSPKLKKYEIPPLRLSSSLLSIKNDHEFEYFLDDVSEEDDFDLELEEEEPLIELYIKDTKFVTHIKKTLSNPALLSKLNINAKTTYLIKTIIERNIELLEDMGEKLNDILQDIDEGLMLHHIPDLILMMKDLFNMNLSSIPTIITEKDALEMIQNILILLIETGVIPINPSQKMFYEKMINSSVSLLETSINLEKKIEFCPKCEELVSSCCCKNCFCTIC